MPPITFDGRSFQIDSRRIWIVSGSLHYTRIPREHWEERIHAAKHAGLNTIDVPVFWNRHESRPGHFDFSGDNDVRHFIQLIGQAGLYAILRPGPYIGEDWDLGGLPPWLATLKDIKLRAGNQTFLEASSRYLNALADKVRDLQMTAPGKAGPGGVGGGPIILVQSEAQWHCGDDRQGEQYLTELHRYFHEAGFTVPIINSNNLWQSAEGEIECWSGGGDLLSTVRQLATVRPDRPRMVIDFEVASQPVFGEELPDALSGATLEQRLAEILAGAGQFNLHPFHGGTNFGFWGGRLADAPSLAGGFATASRGHGAPLTESGQPGPTYAAIRRLCTFASRFSRVFSNLDPSYRPVVAAPHTSLRDTVTKPSKSAAPRRGPAAGDTPMPTVLHATGPQGSIAFVFDRPTGSDGEPRTIDLLLADGSTLPVECGVDGVTWCVFDAFLGGRAKLDYSNLSAFAAVGKVLVVFGRPGQAARLSINNSPLDAEIPKPKSGIGMPTIVTHESCQVVLATREQLEQIALTDDAVFVGVSGLNAAMQPIALPGAKSCIKLTADGEQATVPAQPAHKKVADKITVNDWLCATAHDYCDGSSARFATIDGPGDLTVLGAPFGYGWYRAKLKNSSAGKVHAIFPMANDRLHVFLDGVAIGTVGRGAGAESELTLPLKKGEQMLTLLAENMGRPAAGVVLHEKKGIFGHIFEGAELKGLKPARKNCDPIDILAFATPIWGVQPSDRTLPDRMTWSVPHKKKVPLMIAAASSPCRALLVLNEKPIAVIDRGGFERILIPADQLKSGLNTIQLALIPTGDDAADDAALNATAGILSFYEALDPLTDKAEWSFARWEPPRASLFAKPKAKSTDPTWWRTGFRVTDAHTPLSIDLAGMTKGQVYVNGKHLGRYFVATADGKPVPPRLPIYVPAAWLRAGEENELLIFDEHGGNPTKIHITPDPAFI